jgi:NADH:ubiquinone oxidoreductase subunit H
VNLLDLFHMLFFLLESIIILLPLLGSIAFMTLAERKLMASMQRRVGPNVVGFYGTLQPFADGLKLLLKEAVIPSHANKVIFLVSPFITLSLALMGWAVIPFAKGTALADISLGVLFLMAVSSLGVYGVLLAGWSANSKYAFLGSLRSSAQLVSYELPLAMQGNVGCQSFSYDLMIICAIRCRLHFSTSSYYGVWRFMEQSIHPESLGVNVSFFVLSNDGRTMYLPFTGQDLLGFPYLHQDKD